MESMQHFISKFTNVVKDHLEDVKESLGKEVVDASASKTGIVIDRIKVAFGAKFSLLQQSYSREEEKIINSFDEDVLVCQAKDGTKFFVPVSEVAAMGGSVVLVKSNLNLPEVDGSLNRRKYEVFRRYFETKENIKEFLPKVEEAVTRKRKRKPMLKLFH